MDKELALKIFKAGWVAHSNSEGGESFRDEFDDWWLIHSDEFPDAVQERIATALERLASAVVDPNDPYVRSHLNVSK